MIHAHITTWIVALILFFVALSLNKSGKTKGAKIVQMILRLFYLLIIATGVGLLSQVSNIDWKYILKAVAGLWVIGTFEMILSRVKNDRRTSVFWIQFVVAFALALYLGFAVLPMSFLTP
ncbi:YisL family protein [Neobacillus cucumis]|uniref:YisL family protein n=1 Tax=Neobacillus cucumis TaxID=1740721 RepID=UPI0018DF76AB|nr:YisL family protein [Neobacillus cucumis]MBI0579770.1 YisL family protein [Neobacillus cucumis]WHY93164.1 YisL family protein [Neobacillus cucumis]